MKTTIQKFSHKTIPGLIAILIVMLSFTNAKCQLEKVWETDAIFLAPESVVFDAADQCLYVSNFNDQGGFRQKNDTLHNECISKLGLDGKIQELRWIDNLLAPTGLAIYKNKLYIVERGGLSIANIEKREIERRIPIAGAKFLNDVVIAKNGTVYISDSNNHCIYKIENGKSEIWYSDTLMNNPNGLFIDKKNLLVGNRSEANLISISMTDKTVKKIAENISVNIDGIKRYQDGYLFSWRTKLSILGADNKPSLLLKSDTENDFLADFEFIKKSKLIIIPTLLTNKVVAYKISD